MHFYRREYDAFIDFYTFGLFPSTSIAILVEIVAGIREVEPMSFSLYNRIMNYFMTFSFKSPAGGP